MALLKLIPDNTNIPFMRWRLVALAISLLLVAGSLGLLATKGLNLGVDFVGGQLIQAKFTGPAPIEEVRTRINALELGDASIQEFGRPDTVEIRMSLPAGDSAAAAAAAEHQAGVQEQVVRHHDRTDDAERDRK